MREPTGDPQLPAGFILVPLSKGTILVLTTHEIRRGLKRGKWWQRVLANARREAHTAGQADARSAPVGERQRRVFGL